MTKLAQVVPKWHEIGREVLIVLGGALIAAVVVGQLPGLKAWIKAQWGDTPKEF